MQPIQVVYILQEGFISKKGVFNTSFQKRWFVLDSAGKFRYYRVDTGQLKGEIIVSDILEANCNAFVAAENHARSSMDNALTGGSGSGSGSGSGGFGLLARFRGQTTNNSTNIDGDINSTSTSNSNSELDSNNNSKSNKSKSNPSSGSESDKGFFVKTNNRLYVFQADTAAEAANWVITLRKFINK